MWCKNCNIETNEKHCPICGSETVEDLPVEIYWCDDCRIPIIQITNQADKGICPICKKKTKYLASDLRPVFPEERLLISILLNKDPEKMMHQSVWAANSRYYIDGKPIALPSKLFQTAETDAIAEELEKKKNIICYETFDKDIANFIKANKSRLDYLKDEAFTFINRTAAKFKEENIVVCF
jgi:phosphoadenosine phosphosulfate reductase